MKKPEVGDVWKSDKETVVVYDTFVLSDLAKAIKYLYLLRDGTIFSDADREELFIKCYTYLGKSKASINDLFKVQNNT